MTSIVRIGEQIENPKISIIVVCFNHAEYISQCLTSIFCQECDFDYELIIHDDASTDKSILRITEIIETKNMSAILVCQSENIWSQGKNPVIEAARYAKSGLIAVCEGDDYWLSPDKLQIQRTFMAMNPGYDLACHSAQFVSANGTSLGEYPRRRQGAVPPSKALRLGGGLCATASIMIRKSLLDKQGALPMRQEAGDVFMIGLAAIHGKIWFEQDLLCAYRINHSGSYSSVYNYRPTPELIERRHLTMIAFGHHLLKSENCDHIKAKAIGSWIGWQEYVTAVAYAVNGDTVGYRKHARAALFSSFNVTLRVLAIWPLAAFGLADSAIDYARKIKRSIHRSKLNVFRQKNL